MYENSDALVRAVDRLTTTLERSLTPKNLELKATRLIYAGSAGSNVYVAPANQTIVITHVWAYASSGTQCTLSTGGTVAIKGDTNSQDFLYSEMPVFLFGGDDLDLTNGTWYIVGYNKNEV